MSSTAKNTILERINQRLLESDRDVLVAAKQEIERLQVIAKTRSDLLVKIFNSDAGLPADLMQAIQNHIDGR